VSEGRGPRRGRPACGFVAAPAIQRVIRAHRLCIVFVHAPPHETDVRTAHRRLQFVTVAFGALAALGLLLALVYGDSGSVALVHRAGLDAGALRVPACVTKLRLYLFYILFLALFAWGWVRREPGLKLIAQGYFLAQLLGSGVDRAHSEDDVRTRPPDATPLPDFGSEWAGFSWDAAHHSFPSGHTADIVTSALFAALLFRNPWAAGVCLAWRARLP